MSVALQREEAAIAEVLALSIRGPKRNGLFAVWLLLRVAGDILPPAAVSDRTHRRRVQNFERRLSSLSLPPGLRRAIAMSARQLREGAPTAAALAVKQVTPSVREILGPRAGEILASATRTARAAVKPRVRVGTPAPVGS